MLRNLSLRAKLALTIAAIGVVVGGVNIYQIFAVRNIEAITNEVLQDDVHRLDVLQTVRNDSSQLLNIGVSDTSVTTGEILDVKTVKTTLVAQAEKLNKDAAIYEQLSYSDPEIRQNAGEITQLVTSAKKISDHVNSLSDKNARENFRQLDTEAHQASKAINSLLSDEETIIDHHKETIKDNALRVQKMLILMTIGVTAVSVLIGIVLMTSIARSLARLRSGAARIANGDFSTPVAVTTNDEIGNLARTFNTMAERLRDSYRRLAVEQQRDEAILQNMGEGLIATDENGKILLLNHIACDYLSITDPTSVKGKFIQDVYEIYEQDDKDKHVLTRDKRPIYIALTSEETVENVYAFYAKDGKKVLLNITATPIKLEDKVVGAISIMRDVTKEKEIDRMKTEFISLASHQLRTPLSAIKWFTEMLVSGDAGKLTDEQLEFAKNIDDSTERMIALVNALLNISRIESGRIMIDPKPTDLKELVSGIVTDLKAKTEERQQTLLISVHDELPKINLDPRLIGQVYLNLLTNAVKYTPKGGEISVFISKKDGQIISQVTDNGYGIPKEQQPRLFEKFFRASNAVKVETDGTGLGLYLIKAVIESSGGKIWFKSEEGKGSTFWFSIPVTGMKAKQGEVTLDV